ncbi:MAG: cohesin domain-containing protein [bacterium]|nr:cohesin domain-containing protein [bacterium]
MFKIKKSKFIILFTIFYLLFSPSLAQAAEYYFGAEASEQAVGSTFAVGLFVNSAEEIINAVEGQVSYPADILELKEIRDGDSVVNFWVERPEGKCEPDCFVRFAGVTPGGFVNERGHLFSMIFSAKNLGETEISVSDGKVLRHDGVGSETSLKNSPIILNIVKEGEARQFILPFDTDSPESFVPFVGQDTEIFDNKLFLVFATQDKLSGIAGYAIHESTQKKDATQIDAKDWVVAESPYLLKDQNLSSYIYVMAVDKSGNQRIQIIPPTNPVNLLQKYWFYGIILLAVLFIYILRRILWRKKQNTKLH